MKTETIAFILILLLLFTGLGALVYARTDSKRRALDKTETSSLNEEIVTEKDDQDMPNNDNTKLKGDFTQLVKEDISQGSGAEAVKGKTLKVNYTGKLVDGTVFDSSLKPGREPFEFTLGAGQVIQGWDQGFEGMKEGGKRLLKIPSNLGYGERGAGQLIKPGADLIFEVELLEVK